MAHLYLVKGNKKEQHAPRRSRGPAVSAPVVSAPVVSTERRYRYPSEEIWQVSNHGWQTAEARNLPARDSEPSTPNL